MPRRNRFAKKKRHTKRNFLIVLIILMILCVSGAVWNVSATKSEEVAYPPEGEMVEVFDTKMHVYSVGDKTVNEPAVVLISGLSTPSPVADFSPICTRLANMQSHRVVVLERPGYGWSQSTKRERSLSNIIEEDRAALAGAGIAPPYLLVAHSIGGIEANLFAATYPDEVSGILLLDCASPEIMIKHPLKVLFFNRTFPALRSVGILRLLNVTAPQMLERKSQGDRNNFANVNEHYKQVDIAFVLQKYQNKMMLKEQGMSNANAKAANAVKFPLDLPVTLIVSTQEGDENQPGYEDYMEAQRSWVNQSNKGRIVTMTGGHYIHHFEQNAICDLIEEMLTSN